MLETELRSMNANSILNCVCGIAAAHRLIAGFAGICDTFHMRAFYQPRSLRQPFRVNLPMRFFVRRAWRFVRRTGCYPMHPISFCWRHRYDQQAGRCILHLKYSFECVGNHFRPLLSCPIMFCVSSYRAQSSSVSPTVLSARFIADS
jgi:hypothetical protein